MPIKMKLALVGLLAAAIAAGAGAWAYQGYRKQQQEQAIAAAVGEATKKLRAVLAAPSREAAASVDAGLGEVKKAGYSPLADAAEHYILGAREIARTRVEGVRLAHAAAAGRQALSAHMRSARGRGGRWFRDAVDLKKQVERDHRDLERTLKLLEDSLTSLPDSAKRLEPHLGAGALLEDSLRQRARTQAQDDARRAAAELQKVRNLTP
jgi:hypothetical protein